MERTDQHHPGTGDPQVTVLDTLRIVRPTTPGPRPKLPTRQLTARPVPHDPWSADRYDAISAADAFGNGAA